MTYTWGMYQIGQKKTHADKGSGWVTLSARAHAIEYPIVFNSNSSIKQKILRIPCQFRLQNCCFIRKCSEGRICWCSRVQCSASRSLHPTAVMRAAPLPLPSSERRNVTSHFGAKSLTVWCITLEKLWKKRNKEVKKISLLFYKRQYYYRILTLRIHSDCIKDRNLHHVRPKTLLAASASDQSQSFITHEWVLQVPGPKPLRVRLQKVTISTVNCIPLTLPSTWWRRGSNPPPQSLSLQPTSTNHPCRKTVSIVTKLEFAMNYFCAC